MTFPTSENITAPPANNGNRGIFSNFFHEYGEGEKVPPPRFLFRNRWSRLLATFLATATCTVVYYGWTVLVEMLSRAGAYSWKCPSDYDDDLPCDLQKKTLQSLYIVAQSSEFSFSILAGAMVDALGPFRTGCSGMAIFSLGWILLMVSSQSVQLYIPAMICLGGSVNLVAYPCLVTGAMFPRWAGLAVSIVISGQDVSSIVAPVMLTIWNTNRAWTFNQVIGGYLGFVVLPVGVYYCLALPWAKFPPRVSNANSKVSLEGGEVRSGELELHKATEGDAVAGDAGPPSWDVVDSEAPTDSNQPSQSASVQDTNEAGPELSKSTRLKQKVLIVGKQVLSPEWTLFATWYCMQILVHAFYPTAVSEDFNPPVQDFFAWMNVTRIGFGLFLGCFVDYTTTLPLCFMLAVIAILGLGLSLLGTATAQYASVLAFVVAGSYIYTVKYTYLMEIFPQSNFGTLVGCMGTLSGLVVLLNLAVRALLGNKTIFQVYIGLTVASFSILIYLWYRFWFQKITYKETTEKTVATTNN